MSDRKSGVLLHITSLPSAFGIGDLGPRAYEFVDFLSEAGQALWQILPLTPTQPPYANSPYHSNSSFACNPLLVSPELLTRTGWIREEELENRPSFPSDRIDYPSVAAYKFEILDRAYERFKSGNPREDYDRFRHEHGAWVEDFALFKALKSELGGSTWRDWPKDIRDRLPGVLSRYREELEDRVQREIFYQFLFFRQWDDLRGYCREKGVGIIGDLPIYVVFDSADVWTHPGIFKLDEDQKPYVVAGVPPDYFSETGQLWGNPVYRWDILAEQGYEWWVRRVSHNLRLYDTMRVDHFRGFVGYWEVPAHEETALGGTWVQGPGRSFFDALLDRIPTLPIIAEDLGFITPDVHEVMHHYGFPGMKILLFAFGEDLPTNPYAPHNHGKNFLVYTGTHDNNTVRGWYEEEATPAVKERLRCYTGGEITEDNVHWALIRLAMMSVADTVVIPMQDILGLDGKHRMNRPSVKHGNWEWKLNGPELTGELAIRLREMASIYGRI